MLQKRHMETFSTWLTSKINTVENVSNTVKWLANSPRQEVFSYSGYVVNGQRFHTKDVERFCRPSARDTNQIVRKISYYIVIKDNILLDYYTFQIFTVVIGLILIMV
ncbi:hypothetical protein PanWU01x14_318610 [Parasponia andersonii]|uniref:Uncharacterized protein n=1 Tax=Parasponia andersonii TaxID=3476 RepID=A0A2P5AM53_PARAD|nr:hypothetical protein PanWU01x14_318610 [Parasponia andersonii]